MYNCLISNKTRSRLLLFAEAILQELIQHVLFVFSVAVLKNNSTESI